jgi:hypothetical protein
LILATRGDQGRGESLADPFAWVWSLSASNRGFQGTKKNSTVLAIAQQRPRMNDKRMDSTKAVSTSVRSSGGTFARILVGSSRIDTLRRGGRSRNSTLWRKVLLNKVFETGRDIVL